MSGYQERPMSENARILNVDPLIGTSRNVKKLNTGIYQIVNIINGKRYIGSAKNLYCRKSNHFKNLRDGVHHSRILQNSYNKYGAINFKFEILLYCAKEDLIFFEQRAIDSYDLKNELFNILPKAGSWMGQRHSLESKIKMSISSTGKKVSEETKIKISNSTSGNKNPNFGKYGENNIQSKPVYQIDAKLNKIIFRWDSQRDAEKNTNIDSSSISKACRLHTLAGGYRWSFVDSNRPFEFKKKNINKRIKPIYQIDYDTNEIIKIWCSIRQAEKHLFISSADISRCCNKKRNKAGGFKWGFANKQEEL